jgi:exodeoxyribonuclease V beta subunit
MYVALTRAKARLYLPLGPSTGGQPRRRGAYDVVHRRLAELVSAGDPSLAVEDVPAVHLVPGMQRSEPGVGEWQPPEALLFAPDEAAEFAALRERHAGALVTSYTRMRGARSGARSAWTDEPEARRAQKAEEAVDEVPATTLRSARASGVFVHEVLERVPLASFAGDFVAWRARADVAALFDEAVAVHRVDPAQRGHAEQLVWAAYTTPVALPGGASIEGLSRAGRVVREMEFVFPVSDARVFVRGSLDVAFEHGGRTYFVDWKTDVLASYAGAAVRAHVNAHYAEQAQLYTLAVVKLLGAHTRADYEARFGGLLYCYLRGMDARGEGLWASRPDWDEVVAWDAALGARRFTGRGS